MRIIKAESRLHWAMINDELMADIELIGLVEQMKEKEEKESFYTYCQFKGRGCSACGDNSCEIRKKLFSKNT